MAHNNTRNISISLDMAEEILCTPDHESIPEILDLLAQPGSEHLFPLMFNVMELKDRSLACSVLKNVLTAHPEWVDYKNVADNTLLIYAVKSDYLDVASMLLDMGARANITDRKGLNALDYASKWRLSEPLRKKISEGLLDAGHFSDEQKDDALYRAASFGNFELVSNLLEHGAGFGKVTSGGTAMANVCRLCEDTHPVVDILRVMLDTERGRQAIEVAAENGNDTYTKPLCTAAFAGNLTALSMLLEAGATVNPPEPPSVLQSQTALMEAAHAAQPEAIELLLKAGADPNYINLASSTALHLLAISERRPDQTRDLGARLQKSLDLLLAAGADLSVRDVDGNTPQETARLNNLHDLADRMAASVSARELSKSTIVVRYPSKTRSPGPRF